MKKEFINGEVYDFHVTNSSLIHVTFPDGREKVLFKDHSQNWCFDVDDDDYALVAILGPKMIELWAIHKKSSVDIL